MSANPIDKLEGQLEALTEGAFTRLFPSAASARDIAVLLLRALEDNTYIAGAEGEYLVAPDRYRIYMHPQIMGRLPEQMPDFAARLSFLITELCQEAGWRLYTRPDVRLLPDESLAPRAARISAEHSPTADATTKRMVAVREEWDQSAHSDDTQAMPAD